MSAIPQFSDQALRILDQMSFDPEAKGRYEYLSGGLCWEDEFPAFRTPEWDVVAENYTYRYLLAQRAFLTLGEGSQFPSVWEQVERFAPEWPGLRPERRGERARKRLLAGRKSMKRCLDELDSGSDTALTCGDR